MDSVTTSANIFVNLHSIYSAAYVGSANLPLGPDPFAPYIPPIPPGPVPPTPSDDKGASTLLIIILSTLLAIALTVAVFVFYRFRKITPHSANQTAGDA